MRADEYALLAFTEKHLLQLTIPEPEEKPEEKEEEEPEGEILKCEDCGNGIINRCDEKECLAIGEKIGKECVFKSRWLGLANTCIEKEGETCPSPNPTEDVLRLPKARDKVLKTVEELDGKPVCLPPDASCHDSIEFVYNRSGVEFKCYYSDRAGKSYIVNGETITLSDEKGSIFLVPEIGKTCTILIGTLPSYEQKLDQIQAGDWLDIAFDEKASHAVIFIEWIDKPNEKALIFDWMPNRIYGYREESLAENTHPVYFFKNPVLPA